jgi:hypothetical protein
VPGEDRFWPGTFSLSPDLEEQLGAGFRERNETQFVADEQLITGGLFLEAQQFLSSRASRAEPELLYL